MPPAQLDGFYRNNTGYSAMMVMRPQTVGYGLSGSPVGLAAWMYDKFAQWTFSGGEPEPVLTRDEMLDDITLYWLTNAAISSACLSCTALGGRALLRLGQPQPSLGQSCKLVAAGKG